MLDLYQNPEVQSRLEKYNKQPLDLLKLSSVLAKQFSAEERHWIADWIELAPKVFTKFGVASLLCDRLALEQSTAQDLGRWKANLWQHGAGVLDLCCGMGGDSMFLPTAVSVCGVDLDPLRIAMYKANTKILGCAREAYVGNALQPPCSADFFQIDPARRSDLSGNQRRLVNLTPNWSEVSTLSKKFLGGLVKLPPSFPLSELPEQAALTYLGTSGDCRECLVGLGSMASTMVQAIEVSSGARFAAERAEVDTARLEVQNVGQFLIEPSPTLVRSHLFPLWAAPYSLWQIDPSIAYLSGDQEVPANPWCTCYRVLDACPLGTERVKAMLKKHGIRPMTLKKRGVEVEPAVELKRLKINEGIPGILFYTRIQNEKFAILTLPPF